MRLRKKNNDYLLQGHDNCCVVYALCNALRYYGYTSPAPGTREWDRLIDYAGCSDEGTGKYEKIASYLGLRLHKIGHGNTYAKMPVFLIVIVDVDREDETELHAVLITDYNTKTNKVEVINHQPPKNKKRKTITLVNSQKLYVLPDYYEFQASYHVVPMHPFIVSAKRIISSVLGFIRC